MLGDLLHPIIQNLLGFDLFIIVMAAFNFLYLIYILGHARQVYNVIYPTGYQPDDFNELRTSKRSR